MGNSATRWLRFNLVGVMGFVLQTALLWLLVRWMDVPTPVAVAIAVFAAVSHNFFWHEHVTWPGRPREDRLRRWLSFNLSTGLVSVISNLGVTMVVIASTGLSATMANAIAVGVVSIANFWINDRVVFRT